MGSHSSTDSQIGKEAKVRHSPRMETVDPYSNLLSPANSNRARHEPAVVIQGWSEQSSAIRRKFEVFRWRNEGILATHHMPNERLQRSQLALILVNAGPAPRAGNSDLSTRIADRVAHVGVPTIRFDFPGVGDSTGRSYRRLEEFRSAAQEAPLDDVLADVVEQACGRFELERVLVGGLCAGAVVCIRGARRMGRRCAGLVLLEPDLLDARFARGGTPVGVRASVERALRGIERRRWTSSVGRLARHVYERMEQGRMPEGIARDVVDAWVTLTESRMPTFLAVAEGLAYDTLCARVAVAAGFELRPFDASEHREPPTGVSCFKLAGTNHLFTAGEAPDRMPEALASWAQSFAESGVERR